MQSIGGVPDAWRFVRRPHQPYRSVLTGSSYSRQMRIPLSLTFFAIQAALLPLEYLPSTGAFLDGLLAPYWPIILLNLGFLGLGFEALIRRVGLLWLLAPLLWFGGYTVLAAKDRLDLKAERGEIATHNAGVAIPFDPVRHALVAKEILFNDAIGATRDASGGLVQHHGLPVFYRAGKHIRGASHTATRMVETALCREMLRNKSMLHTGISTSSIADYRGPQNSPHDQRFCIVNVPEDPVLPQVMVEKTFERAEPWFGLQLFRISTTVITPDGISYNLKGGFARILSWWPLPIVGCRSFGSAPHGDIRECGAGFHRSFVRLVFVDEGYSGDDMALAAALGLQRVRPADRKATTSPELMRTLVAAAQQRIIALEVSELDRVIADPTAAISFVPFENLQGRLDIIQPRLGLIVAAIERGIGLGGKARHNTQQMLRFLETVPSDVIAPYLDRIEAIRVRDGSFVFKPAKPPV